MSLRHTMEAAARANKLDAQAAAEKYKEESRKQLLSIVETKLKTSFIGAISQFEQHFGFLWGNRLPKHKLTAEQEKFRKIWELCRSSVLNNGNNQIRAVQNEFPQYTIYWNRYTLTSKLGKKEDE